MEFIVLDLENATEEELKKGIKENCNIAQFMRSEVEKLRAVAEKAQQAKKIQKDIIREEAKPIIEKFVRNEKDEEFEDEVEYYYSAFKKLTKEELHDEEYLLDALPVRKNYRYKEILYRMIASIKKNIKEIKDFISTEDITLSELEEFREEVLNEEEKIKVLNAQINKKEELLEEETRENKLIFVPSYSGNFHIFDDIEESSQEYYNNYYSLFQSIKDGTFKGVKRFKNDESLSGICEVKEGKCRVVFSRLSRDCYAILTAFVKKTTSDMGYFASLRNRAAEFYNAEEKLKSNLSNEEFLKLNDIHEQ